MLETILPVSAAMASSFVLLVTPTAKRTLRASPDDFEAMYVAIGQLGCEEHYRAARTTVTRWLDDAGKERLKDERKAVTTQATRGETNSRPRRRCPPDFDAAYVRLGPKQCERRYHAGHKTIARWLKERGAERLIAERELCTKPQPPGLNTCDMSGVLKRAFPLKHREIALARKAARYLQSVRNGGWVVSPAGKGLWWVGTRRRTAAEVIAMAMSKGFNTRGEGR